MIWLQLIVILLGLASCCISVLGIMEMRDFIKEWEDGER
ncbi:hypothetical protein QJV44_gp53 [Serratia phage vB_SmaS_Tlacuache]|uniref:Uncharacterized protein n=1 Tax=Serratia phage vB_SmaS_Tlacuache TaxID=2894809 RepID=A0AAE9CEZ9_9CAUD|nr:hypothetical protein QJV44_gp53 [Serratia phage vB_SmaS_Tlacuache]UGO51467.1 hypothetical protein TLACUACHE_53 [Serratia phage vB_SmaS_Tlacuache]